MMIKNFIKAARLRTLPLSISGIIVGTALANNSFNFLVSPIFILAILTTIGFQILSNFANDYGDGIKGTDNNREGEARMVASGVITAKQMKTAMLLMIVFSLITSVLLIYLAFGKEHFVYSLIFFILGISSIVSAIKYTVGKSAYGYSGFGDIFVFIFFGLLAVVGTYFLFTKNINLVVFLPAFSVGLLSTAVLNLNNMRDFENDKKANKNTLVVLKGQQFAKRYHFCLIIFSFIFALLYIVLNYTQLNQFLFIIAYVPLIKHLIFVANNKVSAELDGELKVVALSTFVFALLFGFGQIL